MLFYSHALKSVNSKEKIHIPKHNNLIIGGDINDHIGNDRNNKFFLLNFPKRNSEYLAEFSFENKLVCLNSKKGRKNYGYHQLKYLRSKY